jgi:hypothetical protein
VRGRRRPSVGSGCAAAGHTRGAQRHDCDVLGLTSVNHLFNGVIHL